MLRVELVDSVVAKVFIGKKEVGAIRKVESCFFQYFPKGSKSGGEKFNSYMACVDSLSTPEELAAVGGGLVASAISQDEAIEKAIDMLQKMKADRSSDTITAMRCTSIETLLDLIKAYCDDRDAG